MATKWLVVREYGAGGNLSYEPRYHFDDEAEALACSQRLGRAAATTYSLATLPEDRQGPDHAAWLQAAVSVLQALDPGAASDAKYKVMSAEDFAPEPEGPPQSPYEHLWRTIRDLG